MNRKTISRSLLAVLVSTGLAASAPAVAQTGPMSDGQMQQMMQQRGYGPGMGMMGGGMMDMMGGGMMGMGPGMMMGHGMMGMMGLGPIGMLDLTDEQRRQLNKIMDDTRKRHWETMGKIMDEHARLRDLYDAEVLDAKRIGAVYDQIFKHRREMIEGAIEARNKAYALLTKEQKEQLKQMRRAMPMGPGMRGGMGGMMGPGGMGPGMNR
jgi:Spy/CpxP family protein refolding chaperone